MRSDDDNVDVDVATICMGVGLQDNTSDVVNGLKGSEGISLSQFTSWKPVSDYQSSYQHHAGGDCCCEKVQRQFVSYPFLVNLHCQSVP